MNPKHNFSAVNYIVITILIILATTILVRGSNNMLQTTLPLFVTYNFGFSRFLVGVLGAIFGLSTFFTTVLNARLEPKTRKTAFIVSMALYTVVFLLYFLTDPFFVWFVTSERDAPRTDFAKIPAYNVIKMKGIPYDKFRYTAVLKPGLSENFFFMFLLLSSGK